MILSAELFNQIIAALRSDKQDGQERRTAPRVGLRAEVDVLISPDGRTPAVRMRCRDLSVSGIGLVFNHTLPAGHEFIVRLPATGATQTVYISCVVVHCRPLAKDLFAIGARTIRTLSDAEAEMFNKPAK